MKHRDGSAASTMSITPPFWVMVRKEVTDHVRSWRFVILFAIIALTCMASLYTAISTIRDVASQVDAGKSYLFLKLFTISDQNGTLPPFISFITILGPLLGIALGFDAINSERNKGTLSRVLAQPIARDYLINAKFTASMIVISILLFTLGFLTIALGILTIGIPPSIDEFFRIFAYLILSIVYVGFWLALSIIFSVRFKQAATSALSGISIWLFFSMFYSMIVNVIASSTAPEQTMNNVDKVLGHQALMQNLLRISPSYLFSESTTTLLSPTVRIVGPLSMEQIFQAKQSIPTPLPLSQSLLLIWPEVTGLIAATVVCFAISYVLFMRQEIRS